MYSRRHERPRPGPPRGDVASMPGTTGCSFRCNLIRSPRLAARHQHVRLGASHSARAWPPAPHHLHLPGPVPLHLRWRELQEADVAGSVPRRLTHHGSSAATSTGRSKDMVQSGWTAALGATAYVGPD
eukprot:4123036-Pyramimonas_sp.AAC.1